METKWDFIRQDKEQYKTPYTMSCTDTYNKTHLTFFQFNNNKLSKWEKKQKGVWTDVRWKLT